MGKSGPKPFELKPNQLIDVLRRFDKGESFKTIAFRFNISRESLRNALIRSGQPSNLRNRLRTKSIDEFYVKEALILNRLTELPNITKVIKEFGVSWDFLKREGIKLHLTKEFLKGKALIKGKLICTKCGEKLKNNRWYERRLCIKCGRLNNATYMRKQYNSDPAFRKRSLANSAKWRMARKDQQQ